MAGKPKDMLYNDYDLLMELNKKFRIMIPVYFITDFGMVYGKSIMKHTEQFIVLNDNVEFEYLTNIIVDGNEIYESAREVKKTGLYSTKENDVFCISSPVRKDKEGNDVVPGVVRIRQCPREQGSEFKSKFYKYLDKLDLFKLRALPYEPLNEYQINEYALQHGVDIDIDGVTITIDNSLFPDANKPGTRPNLSAAYLPWDMMKEAIPYDNDVIFAMLRNEMPNYTTYMLIKALVV